MCVGQGAWQFKEIIMDTQNFATPKQVAFIKSLMEQKSVSSDSVNFYGLTKSSASSTIEALLAMSTPQAAPVEALEVGMYMRDGEIYRVQKSRETGNLYAKHLDSETLKFAYAPGAIKRLTLADKMSLEVAKAWGLQTGTCCVCARTLTDPESVEQGIGPVCAGRV